MTKEGDRVKVATKEETIEGILMPEEKGFVILKLDSGYNIGIDKARVKEIQQIAKPAKREAELPKEKPKAGLPKIVILHTGGTIASKVDYETGGVVARFSPEEILAMFPELKGIANIESRLISNMFSEDMRFSHYNVIAKEIKKEADKGCAGVIVTHGTDTLHYTSAALAFMLKDLSIPVILVGSQRSSDRGSTDASLNLVSAAFFIAGSKNFGEVAVCMHENENDDNCIILPATQCRKMHSSRRDAFQAINTTPWAVINYRARKIDLLRTNYKKQSAKKITIAPMDEKLKIGMIKIRPNMFADELKAYESFDGIIIEGTGLGHAPINEIDTATKEHVKIFDAIKSLAKKSVVVMSSQTIYGQINMNVYSTGRKLVEAGVIGNLCATTPETAFIKLAWLLSNHKKDEAKKLFSQSIAGELPERLEKTR